MLPSTKSTQNDTFIAEIRTFLYLTNIFPVIIWLIAGNFLFLHCLMNSLKLKTLMKKIFTLVAMALMAVGVNAEEVDVPLNDWGWSYLATTDYADGVMTITLTGDYGQASNGWSPSLDWSKYSKMSVVFESTNNTWGQVAVLTSQLKEGSDWDYIAVGVQDFNAITSQTTVDVTLNPTLASDVRSIYIKGKNVGDTYKVSRIYLTEAVEYAQVVAFEGSFGPIGWNSDPAKGDVDVFGIQFSDEAKTLLKAGNILHVDFVCQADQGYFQTRMMTTWWNNLPSILSDSYPKVSGSEDILEISQAATSIEVPLTEADAEILKEQGFSMAGHGLVIKKVSIIDPSVIVTGINTVAKTAAVQNGARYNLAGQLVDEGYKGLVIMNGKKVVIK